MLTKALSLPPEITDKIIDLAEYWPHTTTELNGTTVIARGNSNLGASHGAAEDMFLVCFPRPPRCYLRPLSLQLAD